MSENSTNNSCSYLFSAVIPAPMSLHAMVPVSMVVVVQVHMVAVYVGENAVLHVCKSVNWACSSPDQAAPT